MIQNWNRSFVNAFQRLHTWKLWCKVYRTSSHPFPQISSSWSLPTIFCFAFFFGLWGSLFFWTMHQGPWVQYDYPHSLRAIFSWPYPPWLAVAYFIYYFIVIWRSCACFLQPLKVWHFTLAQKIKLLQKQNIGFIWKMLTQAELPDRRHKNSSYKRNSLASNYVKWLAR